MQKHGKKQGRRKTTVSGKELLEQALREPGVAAVMKLYQRYVEVETAAKPYGEAMTAKTIVSASNSSLATD